MKRSNPSKLSWMRLVHRRLFRVLVAIAIPALLLPVGGLVGFGVDLLAFKLQMATAWSRLTPPPESPVELVDTMAPCVAVRGASGEVYEFCDFRQGRQDERLIHENPFVLDASPCTRTDLPDPPGNPIALVEDCVVTEISRLSRFALLGDGSLWSYHVFLPNAFALLEGYITAILLGGMGGFTAGIVIAIRLLTGGQQRDDKPDPQGDPTTAPD